MEQKLKKVTSFLEKISWICLMAAMLVIVAGVLTRAFTKPMVGTDEYTGFIMACFIGLALAHCAINDGHIAVEMLMVRFSGKVQDVVSFIINGISAVFWAIATWNVGKYAYSMYTGGEVTMTTTLPFYPYIYVVAFGVFGLMIVAVFKAIESIGRVVK